MLDDERSGRYQYGTALHGDVDWHNASPGTLFEEAAAALSGTGGDQ